MSLTEGEMVNTDLDGIGSRQRNNRWGRECRLLLSVNGFTNFGSWSWGRSRSGRDRSGQTGRSGDRGGLRGSRGLRGSGSGGRHGTILETDQLQGWLFTREELASGQGRFGRRGWRVNIGLEGVGLYASGETDVFH